MRPLFSIVLFVSSLSNITAQIPEFRFIIDAPGPGYRAMARKDKPQMESAIAPQATLTFQPGDISAVTLVPADNNMSLICLSFRNESIQRIKEYIESNRAKPIRVEIGDYTLPLDINKTLPWTIGVWLEERPNEKARTILETLQK